MSTTRSCQSSPIPRRRWRTARRWSSRTGATTSSSPATRAGDPEAAFEEADGTVSGHVRSARITGAPIEPRGSVASYDPYAQTLTFWDSTQNPHPLRTFLAETLGMQETKIRVIQPHVGGGFGLKQPTFQEQPLIAYLSRKLGRPVKWIEERNENFPTGGHARDTRFLYEAAFENDGTVTGIRVDVIADVGAPTALFGWGMSFVTCYCLPCVYHIPNSESQLRSVVTNKCPWNAYRGFGKDAASFLMDRIMDHIAKETGRDRAEVRFRNFIQPEEFPYPQVSGAMLDSGNYPEALRRVLELVDYEDFAGLQEEARSEGRYIGLGIGQELTPEGCSMPGSLILYGSDGTEVRVSPTGDVTVLTGVTSPGSGNETGIAQIAADALGCELDRIRVVQGDTESCPWGFGNYSSRSMIIGGSAVQLAATEVREKMLRVAANMLEAAPDDLDAADGVFSVRGAPERSLRRRGRRPGLPQPARARTWRASSRGSRRTGTSGSGTSTTSPRSRAASAPIRPGRTASRRASSRSTRRPASSRSCATASSTTPGRSSTRCSPTPTSTAASRRASAARSTSRSPTTRRRSR